MIHLHLETVVWLTTISFRSQSAQTLWPDSFVLAIATTSRSSVPVMRRFVAENCCSLRRDAVTWFLKLIMPTRSWVEQIWCNSWKSYLLYIECIFHIVRVYVNLLWSLCKHQQNTYYILELGFWHDVWTLPQIESLWAILDGFSTSATAAFNWSPSFTINSHHLAGADELHPETFVGTCLESPHRTWTSSLIY